MRASEFVVIRSLRNVIFNSILFVGYPPPYAGGRGAKINPTHIIYRYLVLVARAEIAIITPF
jgi:hypothetical protein